MRQRQRFPPLTLIDPKLRNGYAQDFFLGTQYALRDNVTVEVTGNGALGRRLLTTDLINRQFTTLDGDGRPNEQFPDISWRSGQGISNYYALTSLVKYRLSSLDLQAAYTWSHSIDNQSDPLIGDLVNLDFTAITGARGVQNSSTFARVGDSSGDRGNSDFDQRQNLFLMGTWRSPFRSLVLRHWKVSGLAAFRSGFPYSVLADTFRGLPYFRRRRCGGPAGGVVESIDGVGYASYAHHRRCDVVERGGLRSSR